MKMAEGVNVKKGTIDTLATYREMMANLSQAIAPLITMR
jgi:hypothetical protein